MSILLCCNINRSCCIHYLENKGQMVERLVTDDCWAFEIGDRSFTEDNFNKDRFEKAWIAEHGSQQ